MRLLVGGGIYLARGALFSTMETVLAENPLVLATSRIVTAAFFFVSRCFKSCPVPGLDTGMQLSISRGTAFSKHFNVCPRPARSGLVVLLKRFCIIAGAAAFPAPLGRDPAPGR